MEKVFLILKLIKLLPIDVILEALQSIATLFEEAENEKEAKTKS